ncbi:nitrite reductase [Cupriavidus oxalaticus]|uniref:C-type cytochrome n=1 Tax=Cupriavidus oxalaticus TaxID=96344 RepID=A0A375GFQ9_9BURK|nr:nitrite reductase [Cupriavidus oxalaticus]QRQ84783.1 c-type cytochrome [Cupriavidus oxalaticus]QRQ91128.1 c-type cytochrome [Cupriavidus oxalaticus]WQD85673.1 cytochrome D1 domain-containing protein [Cupriavidus oxalaticus]SPC20821.1 C-type cytochrome [Cupriavidus oxalaticus]
MMRLARWLLSLALVCGMQSVSALDSAEPTAALYGQHCAACHGTDRLGGMGPALLPESLERLRPSELDTVLRDGRAATQMPAFGTTLAAPELQALARWLRTAPAAAPQWGADTIRASHVVMHAPGTLPAHPVFSADPQNLFVVVEAGSHHMTVLDGDRLTPIHRFATRFALHGGPKFSRDGRYVYMASRDGWVSKYDLWNLAYVAEIRVGINTRNVAVSDDGRWVLAGNTLPRTLVLLRAGDLSLARVIEVKGRSGDDSRVSAVYDAAPRHSFIAALKDIAEVWEIPYADAAGKPLASLAPRAIVLDDVLDDFFFDQPYRHILGASRSGGGQVIDLDQGRKVAALALGGMPHLGSGITWERDGHAVMASPDLGQGRIPVIDMQDWHTVATIPTNGPGFFLRSHENSRYAWADAMMSPRRDTLQVIDKQSLQVAGSVTPSPGRTAAHVEFTRDGRYALVSLMERDGAIVVYDAATLREVKRIPMDKPIGKYNVFNKTTRSAGTSH